MYHSLDESDGNNNTAIGIRALASTGMLRFINNNTAVGAFALSTLGEGAGLIDDTNNIAIGNQVGILLQTGSDNIYLGHPGPASNFESQTIRIGQTPRQTRTFIAAIRGMNVGMNALPVMIAPNGRLGTESSSARYKEDIQTMGTRSQGLSQLRPVTFRYKEDAQGERQYGLVAEEVAEVYPELVTRGDDGEVESVRYHQLIPMLVNELQHQEAQLSALTAENERLRVALVQQNAELAARLARLEEGAARATTQASR